MILAAYRSPCRDAVARPLVSREIGGWRRETVVEGIVARRTWFASDCSVRNVAGRGRREHRTPAGRLNRRRASAPARSHRSTVPPARLGASASLDYVSHMARDPDIEMRAFVDAWRIASERLEEFRRRDLRDINVADRIEALNGAFEAALAGPPRTSSGLVEQQAIFARIRHAGSVSAGG